MSNKNYTITLGQYKGLKRPAIEVTVSEEEINTTIEGERQRRAKMVDVEGPAKLGQVVVIDYAGFDGEEQFEGGTSTNFPLQLGSNTFIPGFEDQLVGASAGDSVDVHVSFPKEYHADNLAGKPVVFKCKVHKVQEQRIPELNDLFAKMYNQPNVTAFKEFVRESIEAQKQQQAESTIKNEILGQVAENAEVDMTEEYIAPFAEQMLSSFSHSLMAQGASLEQYLQMQNITEAELREQMRPQAVATAKASAALETVAELEGLTVSDDEIDEDVIRMSQTYGIPLEDLRKDMTPERREMIRSGMLMNKAIDFILEASVVE